MTIRCEGDSWVMEQLGDKRALEFELTRLGFRHEDFALSVQREFEGAGRTAWISRFEVRVVHAPSRRSRSYLGSPTDDWLAHLKDDIACGIYNSSLCRES